MSRRRYHGVRVREVCVKNDSRNSWVITVGGRNIYMESIAVISHVSLHSIFYSLLYAVSGRNFELHSSVDSIPAFSTPKLYRIRDRMQTDVWEAGIAAEGVLEDEERRSLSGRWRIRWVGCSWFTFVFEVEGGCAEKSRIHDENPRSFKVPDGNLVTYKREGVKRRSRE